MCLLRYQDLPHQEGVLDYEVRHSKFIDEPSYTWVNGSVTQLLSTAYKGLTCSYLLGFMSGFDGNKKWPTFHMMSLVYTRGFEDGHVVLEKMLKKGLVTKEGSLDEENDIYKDEKDENAEKTKKTKKTKMTKDEKDENDENKKMKRRKRRKT